MFNRVCLLVLMLAFAAPVQAAPDTGDQQIIMGWIEHVYLQDLNGRLKAKLDTGATISSMRGEVLKIVEPETPLVNGKKAKKSVIFQITDADGKTTTLQRQLVRWVRIKSKSGNFQRRPVVEMDFCVAGHPITSEVNLAPRTDFLYPILVGRNMLKAAHIIVDPSRTFTSRARCPALLDPKDD